MTLNAQDKQVLQNAALLLAEHQRRDEPEVNAYREKIYKLKKSEEEHTKILNRIQREVSTEAMNLRALLIQTIPEDLRD